MDDTRILVTNLRTAKQILFPTIDEAAQTLQIPISELVPGEKAMRKRDGYVFNFWKDVDEDQKEVILLSQKIQYLLSPSEYVKNFDAEYFIGKPVKDVAKEYFKHEGIDRDVEKKDVNVMHVAVLQTFDNLCAKYARIPQGKGYLTFLLNDKPN